MIPEVDETEEELESEALDVREGLEDIIATHPLKSLVIGFLAGVVLGKLLF